MYIFCENSVEKMNAKKIPLFLSTNTPHPHISFSTDLNEEKKTQDKKTTDQMNLFTEMQPDYNNKKYKINKKR